jgi:hypothetical protein
LVVTSESDVAISDELKDVELTAGSVVVPSEDGSAVSMDVAVVAEVGSVDNVNVVDSSTVLSADDSDCVVETSCSVVIGKAVAVAVVIIELMGIELAGVDAKELESMVEDKRLEGIGTVDEITSETWIEDVGDTLEKAPEEDGV